MDRSFFLWVVDHRADWLDPVLVAVTVTGYGGALWIILALVLAPLGKTDRLRATLLVAACVWTADLLALAIKTGTGRPRPHLVLPEADPLLSFTVSSAMPSGHAATAFAGAVMLAFLVPRAAAYLLALAAVMGFSRIYVGVHWPSDVVAGAALGTAVAVAAILVGKRNPALLGGNAA
ncbi:MAG TPA: phosphatase PAP2 family protein [Gaiellaceae bacterium]|nr:phosphatase PAP2 family protein [Gaiellaceae bacterium]